MTLKNRDILLYNPHTMCTNTPEEFNKIISVSISFIFKIFLNDLPQLFVSGLRFNHESLTTICHSL